MARWRPRSHKDQLRAIGIDAQSGKLDFQSEYDRGSSSLRSLATAFNACKCCFEPDPAAWENIAPPQPGDWLAEHVRETPDQGFCDYVRSFPNRPDSGRHTIFLLPLCDPTDIDGGEGQSVGKGGSFPSLMTLEGAVGAFYQMPVQQLTPLPMESLVCQCREDRGFGSQWHAQQVLQALRARVPRSAFCVLAITMKDLYPYPDWNFCYGLADLANRVGVFSFARHDPCLGKAGRNPQQEEQLLYRSLGTTLHEIGHMFGLKHCTWFNCLMRGNNGDGVEHQSAPLDLCPVCLRKLHWNAGFDIPRRYRDLLEIYECHATSCDSFRRECDFLKQRSKQLDGLASTELPQRRTWAHPVDASDSAARHGRGSVPSRGSSSARSMPNVRAKSAPRLLDNRTRMQEDGVSTKWRAAVEAIYLERAPHHLQKLDAYLAKYEGKEDRLYQLVCKTYGVLPTQF